MSKQNISNSSILNDLALSIVSADVNYTRVQSYIIFPYCIFLFPFQVQFHIRKVKRTTRRGQVCTGWGFLHTDFSLRVNIYRKIFRISYIKKGFLISVCNSAQSFVDVHLQTFTYGNFVVAFQSSVVLSAVVMQPKKRHKVIPQAVPKNDTKAKDIPALHL